MTHCCLDKVVKKAGWSLILAEKDTGLLYSAHMNNDPVTAS